MTKIKIANLMIERELVADLAEATALIMAGKVVVNERRIDKPGSLVKMDVDIRIKNASRYVSRAGYKLEGAIKRFGIESSLIGKRCLDVGASTGGFTDCLLQSSVAHVTAIDIGSNQLVWKLRSDQRVTAIEKTDFRSFDPLNQTYDIIVADVSFISLTSLIDGFSRVASKGSILILMVKPQFEIQKALVPEGGVVENDSLIFQSVERVKKCFVDAGFRFVDEADSVLPGRYGNRERFIYLTKP